MELDLSHPSIEDLRHAARKRIPKFAFEYLDSATGRELGLKVNREALDAIGFMPSVLCGRKRANLQTTLMGPNIRSALWNCTCWYVRSHVGWCGTYAGAGGRCA